MTDHTVFVPVNASIPLPAIRRIEPADLLQALRAGFDDFWAIPTHVVFLAIIYPIIGFILTRVTMGEDLLPLVYPLISGFALLGPIAAIGLYELSWRRERGLDASWRQAFAVFQSPSRGAIATLGVVQLVIFIVWLGVARGLYVACMGNAAPVSLSAFFDQIFTTPAGWALIVVGNAIGFLFAVVALTVSVVSYPLLLERNVGAVAAMRTSIRAVQQNPRTMALWGLIVAAALLVGTIPFFIGLAIVMPILGHATWHLYRKVVGPQVAR